MITVVEFELNGQSIIYWMFNDYVSLCRFPKNEHKQVGRDFSQSIMCLQKWKIFKVSSSWSFRSFLCDQRKAVGTLPYFGWQFPELWIFKQLFKQQNSNLQLDIKMLLVQSNDSLKGQKSSIYSIKTWISRPKMFGKSGLNSKGISQSSYCCQAAFPGQLIQLRPMPRFDDSVLFC